MKYILQPDGSIKNIENSSEELSRSEVKNIKNKLANSIYQSRDPVFDVASATDLPGFESLNDLITRSRQGQYIGDLDEDFFSRRVELKKNESFDFVNPDSSESIYSYRPFNLSDEVFAREFEILSGWAPPKGGDEYFLNRLNSIIAFISNSISYIGTIEAFVEANRIVQGTNDNVAESYTFRYGNRSIDGIDVYSKFILNKLNYPKTKMSIDERFISFIIGFLAWIKPDRLIDIDYLTKEISANANTDIKSFLELTGTLFLDKTFLVSAPPLNVALTTVLYIVEALLTINGSLEKRVKLLFNKFSQEKIWQNRILYSAKKSEDDATLSSLSEFNYYYVKFYIERINVGSSFLRSVLQKGSYYDKREKESPDNRTIGGKFFQTLENKINSNVEGKYEWNSLLTKRQNVPGEQATRIRSLPQGLLLNKHLLKDIFGNKTPAKGKQSLKIGEDILQNFYVPKSFSRYKLPISLVRKIEDSLESEYMPFYFHDLRTNEILSFHAFLDTLQDTFKPDHETISGIGRVEPVKTYRSTSRTLSLSFHVVATSKKDFDLMWYQINKLISMIYPQYTRGIPVSTQFTDGTIKETFSVPFSQMPGNSPLIRLRVGDVIKSNYSPTNISRMHEIRDEELDNETALKALFEKSVEIKPDIKESNTPIPIPGINENQIEYILLPGMYRKNMTFGFTTNDFTQGYIKIKKAVKVKIEDENIALGKNNETSLDVKIIEKDHQYKDFEIVADTRCVVEYKPGMKQNNEKTSLESRYNQIVNPFESDGSENLNNPVTLAFETNMSRGLPGIINSFQMDDMIANHTWETGVIGSRGPRSVKITLGFDVIHDITPGLDYTGMMRAPVYNLGQVNNEMFGDPSDKYGKDNDTGQGLQSIKKKVNKINRQ
jgi:hypothetical protein